MLKVLFLGSHPQSFRCFQHLVSNVTGIEIVGITPHQTPPSIRDDQDVLTIARMHGIPLIELGALPEVEFDLGISLMFDRVLSAAVINKPKRGFVNIHLGPLPRFRGSNSVLHAIRLARADDYWKFGVTLHYMIEELDSGPIIDMLECPIYEDDTAYSLHTRACDLVPPLFERNIRRLVESEEHLPSLPQEGKSYFFKKGAVVHEIDLTLPPQDIYDRIRALTFPGKSKPYAMIGGLKIYLSLEDGG